MARTLDIIAPSATVDALLGDLDEVADVIAIQRQREGSVVPPGDVLTITVTNKALHPLMRLLTRHRVGLDDDTVVAADQPVGVIAPAHRRALASGRNEAAWEEMQRILTQDGGATINTALLMGIAGALTAVALSQGALHVAIGAMVIAPGFEPMVRIALGLVAGSADRRYGLVDLAIGYGSLVVGAMAATVAIRGVDPAPLAGGPGYVDVEALVRFWTTLDLPGLLASMVAGVAGAVVVATFRAVLTAGVMIALALIPSAALVGMAIVIGDGGVLRGAALRWAVDVAIVTLASVLVLTWKRRTVHRRDSLM